MTTNYEKMIIKNCPAYLKYNKCLHNGHCDNITNCVMKQIVERADLCLCPEVVELLEIEEADD